MNHVRGRFAARWLVLRPRRKEATNIAYREQVKPFADRHGSIRLRDVTVELDGATLTIHAGARVAAIPLDQPGATIPAWIRTETPELSRPGNVVTELRCPPIFAAVSYK